MVVKSKYMSLPKIAKEKLVLVCVDLQYMCCMPGYGGFRNIQEKDWENCKHSYYFNRLRKTVVPNVALLQKAFRQKGIEIIHLRIQSLTQDGRDRSLEHKRLGSLAAPGSKEAEFLTEITPVGDEIVINKTGSGAFNCTNLEYVLRNIEKDQLIVVGCETSECVETLVRDAADRSFTVIVPEDATAAMSQETQDSSINAMNFTYAYISRTEDVIEAIKNL